MRISDSDFISEGVNLGKKETTSGERDVYNINCTI